MQADVYAALAFCVNALIMFTGYTFILTLRFRRTTTILVPTTVIGCVCYLIRGSIYVEAVRGGVIMPILIFFVLVLFRDKLLMKISAIVLMEAAEVFSDMATWPLVALTERADDRAQLDIIVRSPEALYARVYYWMILILLIFVLARLWNKFVRPQRLHRNRGQRFILSASLLLCAQVLFLEQMSEMLAEERVSQYVIWLLALVDGIAFLMLCSAFGLFRDSAFLAAEADNLRQRKRAQQKYMDALTAYAASIEKTWSDLYSSVDTLGMLLDYGTDSDVLRALDHMANPCAPPEKGIYAANSLAVNSLVTQKAAAAQDIGASFDCSTSIDLVPPLTEFDACTILSNVLDNALAGTKELPDGRWIRLQLTQRAGLLLLECTNSCAKSRDSAARGREHGLGLRIVQDTVRRNKGTVHLTKDDMFRIVISLPVRRAG